MCRLLAALRLSTHTEHVLPPHLAARFHKLPVCRGDGGESSPIRAFSAQVQPVIAIGNACEATDANSDINACLVHGWISRRSTHNLKNRCMAETYTDLENAEKHPARRYAVTFLMGTPRASLGFSG